MDEEALKRYRIFRRLGMFPIGLHSARGAAQFLRAGDEVLARQQILAVTPQGQFTDVRSRPVVFQPGLAALLHRRCAQGNATTVLPLALEYTFWDQRLPEVLVNCGTPLLFDAHAQTAGMNSQQSVNATLERAMERTQDELAALALARDPAAFRTVLEGRRGSAGFYGWIERFGAVLKARATSGDHLSAALSAAHSHTTAPKD